MTNQDWQNFFIACTKVLGKGQMFAPNSESWCAWTNFSRITSDTGYWKAGLPNREDIADDHIKDGGVWGQPFLFSDLAHIIIPREFEWERFEVAYANGTKSQDIDTLSDHLRQLDIPHNLSEYCLDIKLF